MRFTPAMISVAIAIGAMSVGRAFATADPGQLEARQSTRCITPLVACTTNTTCASCATFPPVIPSWTCRTVPGSSQGANVTTERPRLGQGVQRTQAISLERAQRRNGSWDTAPERNAPLFFEDLTAEVPAAAKLLNGVEGPSRLCSYLQGAVLGVVLAMLWTSFLDDTQDPSAPRVNDRSSRKRRKVDAVGPPLAMLPNTYNDDDAQPSCNFSATMSLRILHCAGSSDSSKKEGVSGGSVSGTVMLAFGRLVIAVLLVLAATLVAGYLWYRRRRNLAAQNTAACDESRRRRLSTSQNPPRHTSINIFSGSIHSRDKDTHSIQTTSTGTQIRAVT
ncbi:hypothetical protein BD311DRAFT_800936 [Dichomitus squalens]|uniref:Transmembrane protein n=1 Tax=Dichomitus squalens TaxID=114155 RepID=A0A4Q9M737_9APHY|nr:hypothetical protein BD311DRAFT_800936 [Dichomitus squalens]